MAINFRNRIVGITEAPICCMRVLVVSIDTASILRNKKTLNSSEKSWIGATRCEAWRDLAGLFSLKFPSFFQDDAGNYQAGNMDEERSCFKICP